MYPKAPQIDFHFPFNAVIFVASIQRRAPQFGSLCSAVKGDGIQILIDFCEATNPGAKELYRLFFVVEVGGGAQRSFKGN